MNRRNTVLALLALFATALPPGARAQAPRKVRRIGFLSPNGPAVTTPYWDEVLKGLRDAGYLPGRDFTYEVRNADGDEERLALFAAELVRFNIDVIVAVSTYGASAALKATATIPIVFVGVSDPVAMGFVNSLGRPGRNMTGSSGLTGDLTPKRLELLRLAIPKLSRVAFVNNPGNPYAAKTGALMRKGAESIGVKLLLADWKKTEPIGDLVSRLKKDGAQAIVTSADPLLLDHLPRLFEAAIKNRMATVAQSREWTVAGALMSYGVDRKTQFRDAATYVDKILKGAKPGDLPVEQPTRIELVINLKTAKAIGVTIPMEMLTRADELIR